MRKLLLATALATLPLAAHALVPSTNMFEGYSISDDNVVDDPTINPALNQSHTFSFNLGQTYTFNLATWSPQGSGFCYGPDCQNFHLLTDPFNVHWTFTDQNNVTRVLNQGGTFLADYTGHLPCVGTDPVSQSESDCVIWTGAGATTDNNYPTLKSVTDTVNFGDGYTLTAQFNNAIDWSITPTVAFTVNDAPPAVPEPASLALLATGIIGLGAFVRKRA